MAGLRFKVEVDAVLLLLHTLHLVTMAVLTSAILHLDWVAEPSARARHLRLHLILTVGGRSGKGRRASGLAH
jgi:hypothetical protein